MGRSVRVSMFIMVLALICISSVAGTEYASRKGFVTLQFDDSHWLHYSQIFPLLESHGYKGSFGYVTESSQLGIEHYPEKMQAIYQAGHEIQDHTLRHDYKWATHIDTVRDDIREWIEHPMVDVATWDSLCERSLFIIDSLGMEAIAWNQPGGGPNTVIPGHPEWSWLGDENDSLYALIGSKYSYAIATGVWPQTAHLNLRGHNCPDRYPFFNVPHWTIDERAMGDVITDVADAVASGLWYLAVSHAKNAYQVAQVETPLEWLSTNDIEVVPCREGVERVTLRIPDPLCNQFPQARMTMDRDCNNKPDGFIGECEWDTLMASPVEGASCIKIYGDTEFICYGPEAGRSALSVWLGYPGPASGLVRVIWGKIGFEWEALGDTMVTVFPDVGWTLIDSTTSPRMLIDIGEEVDRLRVIIRPIGCAPLLASYPSLVLTEYAGASIPGQTPEWDGNLRISPNPVRPGDVVTITPARDAVLYDVMGRHVLKFKSPLDSDLPQPGCVISTTKASLAKAS